MSNIQTNVVKPEVKITLNDKDYFLFAEGDENILENNVSNIENFIKQDGKGKSEDVKNQLYADAQNLWREYADSMKTVKYNFHLNRPQWKFLTDLLLSKLEYDVNTVFFAIELTHLLGSMRETSKYTNDTDLQAFPVTATEITYVYHLISNHKIKGLTKDAFLFSEVLVRIGNISKVLNYYDALGKSLSSDIQDWVAAFEEGVTIEGRETETINGEVLEPENTESAN
jgi:hypothetical protein